MNEFLQLPYYSSFLLSGINTHHLNTLQSFRAGYVNTSWWQEWGLIDCHTTVTYCPPHVKQAHIYTSRSIKVTCDKASTFCLIQGLALCHRAFWRGWTLCYMWQSIHLQPRVDEKYLDRSYSCKNVTGANCHSRQFIGWTDGVGQNVAGWSVCGWTHRQCILTLQFHKR
jgi:hypothetical protein